MTATLYFDVSAWRLCMPGKHPILARAFIEPSYICFNLPALEQKKAEFFFSNRADQRQRNPSGIRQTASNLVVRHRSILLQEDSCVSTR